MALTRPKIWDLDTTIQYFNDPILVLNSKSTEANVDVGVIFNRDSGISSNVAVYWSESTQSLVTAFTSNTGNVDSNISITSYANLTTGGITVSGNIMPSANVTYDIGSADHRFKTIWLAGSTIHLGDTVISATDLGLSVINSQGGTGDGLFANIVINSGLASTSTTTGALQVAGGVGVTGNLYAGNLITQGAITTSGASGNISGVNTLFATTVQATTGNLTNVITGNLVATGGNLQTMSNIAAAQVWGLDGYFGNAIILNANIGSGNATGLTNLSSTNLTATNVSTGNAQITGGAITGTPISGSTGSFTTLSASSNANLNGTNYFNNFNTANAVITGGYINSVTNVYATTGSITNFSTGNAVITGGYIDSVTNVYATTGSITNFSTGNAVITGGYIDSVTNVYATTGSVTNFSTGNAVITGGAINGTPIGASSASSGSFTTLNASGKLIISDTTDSIGTTSGALQVAGGLGVVGNLWVGGNLYVANVVGQTYSVLTVQDPLLYMRAMENYPYNFDIGFYSDFIGGPANAYAHTGVVRKYDTGQWGFFSNIVAEPTGLNINWNDGNLIWDTVKLGEAIVANTTASTNTTSGALRVAGGAGIVGNLYAGSVNTSGNIVGGTVYGSTVVATTVNAATIGNTGATLTGTLDTASQPNITSIGTLGNLVVSGNINSAIANVGTIIATTVNAETIGNAGATLTGTLNTADQPNITSVGTLSNLTVTGAITTSGTSGNISGVNTVFATAIQATTIGTSSSNIVGTGTYLTGLNASNLDSGTVPGARMSGAYTGITQVGTLTAGSIGSGFTAIPNSALANSSITVNGTSISLGSSGTVTADAGTLTGSTLASGVTSSSLTSVGTLTGLTSSGAVNITDTTASTSYSTGALKVTGGVGVQGNIFTSAMYVGSLFWANGAVMNAGLTTPIAGTQGQIQYNLSGGLGAASLSYYANTALVATAGLTSANTTSGSFQVVGGMGVTGTVYTGGINTSSITYTGTEIAIGSGAGAVGSHSVAIGASAGAVTQGSDSIAIGYNAGYNNAPINSISIGKYAGTNSTASGIVLNASGTELNSNSAGFFASPVRSNATPTNIIYYNTTTKELTYGAAPTTYSDANVALYLPTYTGNVAGSYATFTNITKVTNATDNLGANYTSGALQVTGGVGIGGNLYVQGEIWTSNLISKNSTILYVEDPLLYLEASGSETYNYEIGTYSHFGNMSLSYPTANYYQHTGLVRDHNDGVWKLFSNVPEPAGGTVTFTNAIYDSLKAGALVLANTTTSTSTTTGALQVSGGAGISGTLWAGELRTTSGGIALGSGAAGTSQGEASVAIGYNAGNSQSDAAVAIGPYAGYQSQGADSIAIGDNAGKTQQGINAIAIGNHAGFGYTGFGQSNYGIAIGYKAGQGDSMSVLLPQGDSAIAIGKEAGKLVQASAAIAIGAYSGVANQGASAIAIGGSAGYTNQSSSAVAIGPGAGYTDQSQYAVAVGINAGYNAQGLNSVAIGNNAGNLAQLEGTVAIGHQAGENNQAYEAIAIGEFAGQQNQNQFAVAVGNNAGNDGQGTGCVAFGGSAGATFQGNGGDGFATALGDSAGLDNQGSYAVAVGSTAGGLNQSDNAVAVGNNAGNDTQGAYAVAVGNNAGQLTQGFTAVAIGPDAGSDSQGDAAVAVGQSAGSVSQGAGAVAIGNNAGNSGQGAHAVAIGEGAGNLNQPANSIVINASGVDLDGSAAGLFIDPVRNDSSPSNVIYYNTTTKELTYGSPSSSYGNTQVAAYLPTYTGTFGTLSGLTSSGAVSITDSTASTSTTTGALKVSGGVGVAGNVFAGAVYSDNHKFANGTAFSTTLNLNSGSSTAYNYYFSGSNGIKLPTSSNLQFASGDFTIEFWMNAGATQQTYATITDSSTNNQATYIGVGINNSGTAGRVNFQAAGGSGTITTSVAVLDNAWHHIACVKSGANGYIFVDGLLKASTSSWGSVTNAYLSAGQIGRSTYGAGTSGDNTYAGYLSNFRVVKGTALYTSDFVAPTNNLPAVSGTQLLTLQNATLIDNSSNNFSFTAAGSYPTVGTTPALFGGSTGSVLSNGILNLVGANGVTTSVINSTYTIGLGNIVAGSLTVTGSPLTAIINGGTAGVGNIGASGQGFNTVFAKATSAQYADLAEIYVSDRTYEPGTVVIFGGDEEITTTVVSHDTRVAGVISTNPAYLMNDHVEGLPVAFTGRVPTKVQGPVSKGDVLVTSTIAGVAQKIDHSQYQPGCVIGKALWEITTNTIETIEVVVGRF